MAYNDYGAYVYCNGNRRHDKEDAILFDDENVLKGIPSGVKIFVNILLNKEQKNSDSWLSRIHHGIMGDGSVRVLCHKQGLPQIYERKEDGTIEEIIYCSENIDSYDYEPINYEYKGYVFNFRSEKPYIAYMKEPDGTWWRCEYDYGYGAGHDE